MSNELFLPYNPNLVFDNHLEIAGSKSETNRLLLLNALYNGSVNIYNISNSEDSDLMQKAITTEEYLIDIHHAGTAMRFLTAYFSNQLGREVVLTGSNRMKERPIKILVDALRSLGASIEYVENDGYPPLKITGKKLLGGKVSIAANTSSQYLSALLLVGAKMQKGLELQLIGKITSRPYLEMSLQILNQLGIKTDFVEQTIKVYPKEAIAKCDFFVESDWSSASYHYELLALANGKISLSTYKKDSLQADQALVSIYQNHFGVETRFLENKIVLEKSNTFSADESAVDLDLNTCPDIAQTIACTCVGLRKKANLSGLHTLKIKETDRLLALKIELEKLGAEILATEDSLHIVDYKNPPKDKTISISTYNDHRMAMSFAPLCTQFNLAIENPEVVAKSYPDFWKHQAKLGLNI